MDNDCIKGLVPYLLFAERGCRGLADDRGETKKREQNTNITL
jgi:hypothetical protein